MLASVVLGLALWTATPATAQLQLEPCLADPVQCAGETVEEVTDTVDETVEEVTGVEDVTDPVDDVVSPEDEGAPAASGEGSTAPDGSARERGQDPGGSGRGSDNAAPSEPAVPARPGGARGVERPTAPANEPAPSDDSLDSIRQTLSGSTETLAFPLLLLVVLGTFLLVQARLDRSDPKLALAPVDADDDILTF
jgi:hypothetical protein